jgi:hypothetical protein
VLNKSAMRLGLVIAAVLLAGAANAATSGWRTVVQARDSDEYQTWVDIYGHPVRAPQKLRLRIWAPRGRVKVSGWVDCETDADYASRSYGYRSRSRGTRYPLTLAIPTPIAGGRCKVFASVFARPGRLIVAVQVWRMAPDSG